ncbi:MAG TPA: heme-binding protein [Solirubrobacteraceae bacterium]|nr:heme-binding protein [Solirubrobacteraceae bacterium]
MTPNFTRHGNTAEFARRAIEGALPHAAALGILIAAAVVDAGGNHVVFERMDGAQIVAAPLAIGKAWSAVVCSTPTDMWAAATQRGTVDWGSNTALGGRVVVTPGGAPVLVRHQLIGVIGVSGGVGFQDRDWSGTVVGLLTSDESCAPRGG